MGYTYVTAVPATDATARLVRQGSEHRRDELMVELRVTTGSTANLMMVPLDLARNLTEQLKAELAPRCITEGCGHRYNQHNMADFCLVSGCNCMRWKGLEE